MAPQGQKSEHRISMTAHKDYEADWNRQTNRQTDGQDHVWSQADSLTKNGGSETGPQWHTGSVGGIENYLQVEIYHMTHLSGRGVLVSEPISMIMIDFINLS